MEPFFVTDILVLRLNHTVAVNFFVNPQMSIYKTVYGSHFRMDHTVLENKPVEKQFGTRERIFRVDVISTYARYLLLIIPSLVSRAVKLPCFHAQVERSC